jgi:hypothetical protein
MSDVLLIILSNPLLCAIIGIDIGVAIVIVYRILCETIFPYISWVLRGCPDDFGNAQKYMESQLIDALRENMIGCSIIKKARL